MTPPRPPDVEFSSLCELYLNFQAIFLAGKSSGHDLESTCGCKVTIFDHHFFHIVKLAFPGKDRLLMQNEKHLILAEIAGFGNYTYDSFRARHMRSAFDSLVNTDIVCRPDTLDSADRVFIKQYDSSPYPYTVFLIGKRENGLKVPVTAFPVKKGQIKRWDCGQRLFVKTQQPPQTVAV